MTFSQVSRACSYNRVQLAQSYTTVLFINLWYSTTYGLYLVVPEVGLIWKWGTCAGIFLPCPSLSCGATGHARPFLKEGACTPVLCGAVGAIDKPSCSLSSLPFMTVIDRYQFPVCRSLMRELNLATVAYSNLDAHLSMSAFTTHTVTVTAAFLVRLAPTVRPISH